MANELIPDREAALAYFSLTPEERDRFLRRRIAEHDVDLYGPDIDKAAAQQLYRPITEILGAPMAVHTWANGFKEDLVPTLLTLGVTQQEVNIFLGRWLAEAEELG